MHKLYRYTVFENGVPALGLAPAIKYIVGVSAGVSKGYFHPTVQYIRRVFAGLSKKAVQTEIASVKSPGPEWIISFVFCVGSGSVYKGGFMIRSRD